MADKFLQALAGLVGQGAPAFMRAQMQGQEMRRRREQDEEDRDYERQQADFAPKLQYAQVTARQYPDKAPEIFAALQQQAPQRRRFSDIRDSRRVEKDTAKNLALGGTTATAQAPFSLPAAPGGPLAASPAPPDPRGTALQAMIGQRMSSAPPPPALPNNPLGVDLTGAKSLRDLELDDEKRALAQKADLDETNFVQGLMQQYPQGAGAILGFLDAKKNGRPYAAVDPGAVAGAVASGGIGAGVTGLGIGLPALGPQLGENIQVTKEKNDLEAVRMRGQAQQELAKQRALAMSGDKDAANWVKAALAAEAQGRTPEEAVRIANAFREISRGEAPPVPTAPAPNPLAGLLGGAEGMEAAQSALGVPQQSANPLAGLGQSPKFAMEREKADSLIGKREADIERDKARTAQIQRRIDLAFQSEGNANKYRNARLAETKRLNNLIVGLKGRQVSVSEGLLAQRQLEQAWDEEYQATRLLLDEANLNGKLANQEAGRYNQRLNDINTTIRTILRSPSVTPEMMTQVQTLAAEGKQIEDQMFSTMGAPAVRDQQGAITGFQQKATAKAKADKFGFTPSDYKTIKALQDKHGISYEAAANAVRNDNKSR